jgi:uncharacterized protein YebE (UPF0316 family)
MDFINQITDSSRFSWVILPILIFIARIFDVSIGTVRIIFVARGGRCSRPYWFFRGVDLAAGYQQIMQNLDNAVSFIAYACGFAMGNFIGIYIEEKLAMGTLILRVFLPKDTAR